VISLQRLNLRTAIPFAGGAGSFLRSSDVEFVHRPEAIDWKRHSHDLPLDSAVWLVINRTATTADDSGVLSLQDQRVHIKIVAEESGAVQTCEIG